MTVAAEGLFWDWGVGNRAKRVSRTARAGITVEMLVVGGRDRKEFGMLIHRKNPNAKTACGTSKTF
jgi:hypothetical protein